VGLLVGSLRVLVRLLAVVLGGGGVLLGLLVLPLLVVVGRLLVVMGGGGVVRGGLHVALVRRVAALRGGHGYFLPGCRHNACALPR